MHTGATHTGVSKRDQNPFAFHLNQCAFPSLTTHIHILILAARKWERIFEILHAPDNACFSTWAFLLLKNSNHHAAFQQTLPCTEAPRSLLDFQTQTQPPSCKNHRINKSCTLRPRPLLSPTPEPVLALRLPFNISKAAVASKSALGTSCRTEASAACGRLC